MLLDPWEARGFREARVPWGLWEARAPWDLRDLREARGLREARVLWDLWEARASKEPRIPDRRALSRQATLVRSRRAPSSLRVGRRHLWAPQ